MSNLLSPLEGGKLIQNVGRLELGAGSGLVGLAVAAGCHNTEQIYITDQKPMLALMQENIELNSLSTRVSATILNWGIGISAGLPSLLSQEDRKLDVVLAADCVYFEPAFPLLRDTLIDLIGDETVCFFCFKKRRKADWRFMKMLSKALDVREITDDEGRQSYSLDSIFLYKITKRKRSQSY